MFQEFLDDLIGNHGGGEPDRAAKDLTEKCGYAAAALTLLPLPGTELLGVTPIHVGMVVGIGQIYGVPLPKDSAYELIGRIGATVGVSVVSTKLVTTAAKVLLPGLGGLLGAPLIFANTLAIGAVARAYFENGGDLPEDAMKDVWRESVRQAKDSFDPTRARSREAEELAKAAHEASKAEPAVAAEPQAEPAESGDPVARLKKVKALLDAGLIEQAEYDAVKRRILEAL